MPICPEQARAVLPQVDPARMRLDWPVGLRDGALLALLAAGLTAREISRLRASAVMMKRGKVLVAVHRQRVVWYAVLPADLGSRVLVWLTERRLWGVASPVFTGPDGSSLSRKSIYTIVNRYRCPREARRCG